jgi:hypothetical protein
MSNILGMLGQDPDILKSKSLSQILSFIGDGKLRDNNNTSSEFRQLLEIIQSDILKKFTNECLVEKFENNNGGYALQDIINQIGFRLGYKVENGLYQGRKNVIGFDGIWTNGGDYSFVIEVKTTDAYRINLDVLADYRNKLIENGTIEQDKSSILIIVGRQDTGDLEAQIRGSKHAWDIRLLSTDSLIKMLALKETVNDIKTMVQINEILKPNEYTRIDKLIELILLTSQDIQTFNDSEDAEDKNDVGMNINKKDKQEHLSFNDACIANIQKYFNIKLIKETRVFFSNKNEDFGIVCIISKKYDKSNDERYWYGFHPYQNEYLNNFKKAYVGFGCGTSDLIFVIPYLDFMPLLENMNTTENEDRMYWHVVISNNNDKYYIHQPQLKNSTKVEITKYKI